MAMGYAANPNWAAMMAAKAQSAASLAPPPRTSTPATPPTQSAPGGVAPGSFSALASLGNGIGGPELAAILNEFTSNYNNYGDKMRTQNQDQIRAGLQQRGLTETPSGGDIEARGNTDFNNQLAQGYVQQTMPFAQQMAQALAQLKSNRQQMELRLEEAKKMIPIDSQAFHQGARDYKSEYGTGMQNAQTTTEYNRLRAHESALANNPFASGLPSTGSVEGGPAEPSATEEWTGFKEKTPVDYSLSRKLASEYTNNKNGRSGATGTSAGDWASNTLHPTTQSTPASSRPSVTSPSNAPHPPIYQNGPGSYSNRPVVQKPTTQISSSAPSYPNQLGRGMVDIAQSLTRR